VTLLEFRLDFWHQKTTVPGLWYDVVCVIRHLAVLTQYRRVTDGRTDGRTDADGQTHDDSIYRGSIASRGKIGRVTSTTLFQGWIVIQKIRI